MTSKEAVNLFKQHYWKVEDKNKALEILEELVERDTPKKPKLEATANDYKIFRCPECNIRFIVEKQLEHYNDHLFCSHCGQKLLW